MVKKNLEIKKDVHNYICVFDKMLPESILNYFFKYCKEIDYKKAKVLGDEKGNKDVVNERIRKTLWCNMNSLDDKSLTKVHWSNFLVYAFSTFCRDYQKLYDIKNPTKIIDVQILKYIPGGHYLFHTDDAPDVHRTLSCVYFVNDDYEGGDLIFGYPNSQEQTTIEKKKNRLVIFPSNFLYPHTVKPVISGERYSVVAWAL